tara:strand:- start:28 stop:207 length:180 start_codon:yes stop_codon:yes gene_type:complete
LKIFLLPADKDKDLKRMQQKAYISRFLNPGRLSSWSMDSFTSLARTFEVNEILFSWLSR